MRVNIQQAGDAEPAFVPVKVAITFTTAKEFQAFWAIFKTNITVPSEVARNYPVNYVDVRTICDQIADVCSHYSTVHALGTNGLLGGYYRG